MQIVQTKTVCFLKLEIFFQIREVNNVKTIEAGTPMAMTHVEGVAG